MKNSQNMLLTVVIAGLLTACSSTPQRIEELEAARTAVSQVEASPRAGVAASNVAEARKALDRADKLAGSGGKVEDIRFESQVATKQAQIADEKILAAQAQEEIDKGTAERQAVLIESREAEARRRASQAKVAEQRANALEQELAELKAKKTERGMVLTLGDVLFDTALATLKPGAYATIDRLASVLKEAPDRKVMIEGHTDSVGSDEYNQGLSERRAMAVQTALLERGVRADQVTALGKGENYPVASNDNAAGRQQNRRVEMIFTDSRS